jgi:hypothetical protein
MQRARSRPKPNSHSPLPHTKPHNSIRPRLPRSIPYPSLPSSMGEPQERGLVGLGGVTIRELSRAGGVSPGRGAASPCGFNTVERFFGTRTSLRLDRGDTRDTPRLCSMSHAFTPTSSRLHVFTFHVFTFHVFTPHAPIPTSPPPNLEATRLHASKAENIWGFGEPAALSIARGI